jgi:hypothetical protein
MNRWLATDPALARLTLSALPGFAEITGIDPATEVVAIRGTERILDG